LYANMFLFFYSSKPVCVQLPTSAVNVTLLASAAERRGRPAAAAGGRPAAAAVNRYLTPARRSAANPPHATAAVE